MTFAILLILKLLLFMDITKVQHNSWVIFFISTLIILFIFSLIHFSKIRRKRIIGLIIYSIISLIMCVDVMYFCYFNSFPSIRMIKQFNQIGAIRDSIFMLLSFNNLLFILDLPPSIVFHKKPAMDENKPYNNYVRFGIPTTIASILILTFSVVNAKD